MAVDPANPIAFFASTVSMIQDEQADIVKPSVVEGFSELRYLGGKDKAKFAPR